MIPLEPNGYAINEATGEVHKRHAPHALGLRRTTTSGLYAVLGDTEPKACVECWPKPKRPTKTSTWGQDVAKGIATGLSDPEPTTITSTTIDLVDTNGGS